MKKSNSTTTPETNSFLLNFLKTANDYTVYPKELETFNINNTFLVEDFLNIFHDYFFNFPTNISTLKEKIMNDLLSPLFSNCNSKISHSIISKFNSFISIAEKVLSIHFSEKQKTFFNNICFSLITSHSQKSNGLLEKNFNISFITDFILLFIFTSKFKNTVNPSEINFLTEGEIEDFKLELLISKLSHF